MTLPVGPGHPGHSGPRGGGALCSGVAATLLVLLFVTLLQPLQATGAACSAEDVVSVQQGCRQENADFSQAERNDDHQLLCKKLVELWFCVARKVPRCFHNFTVIYQNFLHSPHNCLLTTQNVQDLQKLVHAGGDKGDVDVVPLTSTPSDVTKTADEPDDVTQSRDAQVGDNSKHHGNGSGGLMEGNRASLWICLSALVALWQLQRC